MSILDEAFMLLVLENQYELWMDAESTRVWKRKIHRQCAQQEVLWMEQQGHETFQHTPSRGQEQLKQAVLQGS